MTGWVLLLGSAMAFLLELMAVTELTESVTTSDAVSSGATYSFLWAFSSLGLLAVAEVLKRGRALQTELAEVIRCRLTSGTASRCTSIVCSPNAG